MAILLKLKGQYKALTGEDLPAGGGKGKEDKKKENKQTQPEGNKKEKKEKKGKQDKPNQEKPKVEAAAAVDSETGLKKVTR